MEDVTFLVSAFVGIFAIGYSIGFKILAFKKGIESIGSS